MCSKLGYSTFIFLAAYAAANTEQALMLQLCDF